MFKITVLRRRRLSSKRARSTGTGRAWWERRCSLHLTRRRSIRTNSSLKWLQLRTQAATTTQAWTIIIREAIARRSKRLPSNRIRTTTHRAQSPSKCYRGSNSSWPIKTCQHTSKPAIQVTTTCDEWAARAPIWYGLRREQPLKHIQISL